MIDSQDVSEQELEVLRGDAVGDNLCSSKWIINTLMSLCEVDKRGWTEELEDQLCTLWDLSMEGEVASHLMSYDFPKIAKDTLVVSSEPRLTEMMLGIIGNVCCNDEAVDKIGRDRELVAQILSHLASGDSLILIQLIRILQIVAWKIRQDHQSHWVAHLTECEFFGDSITFMLKSSTNDDLLIGAIKLLESISEIGPLNESSFLEKLCKIDDLIPALLESFTQVISTRKTSGHIEWTFAQHWLAVLIAVIESGSLKFDDYETDERFSKLMEIMYRILKPYRQSYNLYPLQRLSASMIYDAARVLLGFHRCDVNVPTRIDRIIATIIFFLKVKTVSESGSETEVDPEGLRAELLDYLSKYWSQIIGFCTSEQIAEILCEREVRECLINLMQSDPEVTPEALDKVKKAAVEKS
ncbi:PREDICTED: protein SAAL1 [Vollenhovia emeryi]|uniref:protein SAAL1 n=1 Tax=Vollenhovia emeryi TaxID=411798 RepID=UPI0005F3DC08|nr:PREDICTED: protein SAAL1 [Vollenhovia emeryi]